MTGFPARPDRDSFGPQFLNVAPVRDRARHIDAAFVNLTAHQLAGIGLLSPRVMLRLVVDGVSSSLVSRAEAWNPKGLTTGDKAAPSIASPGTGLLTVTYPVTISDESGVDVGIGFSWGFGINSDSPPSTLRHVRVGVSSTTPSEFTVGVFNNAGTLVDGETVTAFVW